MAVVRRQTTQTLFGRRFRANVQPGECVEQNQRIENDDQHQGGGQQSFSRRGLHVLGTNNQPVSSPFTDAFASNVSKKKKKNKMDAAAATPNCVRSRPNFLVRFIGGGWLCL